jgi:cellulose synthase/poly-beta-1,6-N-acetylglucosamine synthase-like glycosyltransferase
MEILIVILQFPLALMVLYLDVLSVAAVLKRNVPASVPPRSRFALLVPAHNEERQLPRLLKTFNALDYPRALYDVHVVADNCTDRTALTASAAGAVVHERHDTRLLGKGYALQWLLEQLGNAHSYYDAYVVVDADSVVSANLLTVMNDYVARGDRVVQCYDGVLNRQESWVSAISYVALALFNNLRPRGRDALGLSVGLRGNGMCFTSNIIERFGWEVFGLAEDHAYHVQLVSAGVRVRYAAEASVLAEQPTSLGQAYSQSVRWERGRFQLMSWRFLVQGFRQRDPAQLDALAEQIVPPFSVLTGAIGVTFLLTAVLHMLVPFLVASLSVLGEVAYVCIGLRLVRAGRSVYLALLAAPVYVAWKLWTVAIAAARPKDDLWVRTTRAKEEAPYLAGD